MKLKWNKYTLFNGKFTFWHTDNGNFRADIQLEKNNPYPYKVELNGYYYGNYHLLSVAKADIQNEFEKTLDK